MEREIIIRAMRSDDDSLELAQITRDAFSTFAKSRNFEEPLNSIELCKSIVDGCKTTGLVAIHEKGEKEKEVCSY
jgi:hypothetical protein